jgi:hypothetical protein
VPDDGTLSPDEEAEGILALLEDRIYRFRIPVGRLGGSVGAIAQIASGKLTAWITNSYSFVSTLSKDDEALENETGWYAPDAWVWVFGKIEGRNYQTIRQSIEMFVQEVQGAILLDAQSRFTPMGLMSPPHMTLGSGSTFNSGRYIHSVATRVAPQVVVSAMTLERAMNSDEAAAPSHLKALFHAQQEVTQEVRQAIRMFLRSFDSWSVGEQAMFLATTLEGLLLDKKNKDDLSARLQDSVAFWLGGSPKVRAATRKKISDIYKARSEFVHNGILSPSYLHIEAAIDVVRKVLHKEINAIAYA